jgi:hypothetical protein
VQRSCRSEHGVAVAVAIAAAVNATATVAIRTATKRHERLHDVVFVNLFGIVDTVKRESDNGEPRHAVSFDCCRPYSAEVLARQEPVSRVPCVALQTASRASRVQQPIRFSDGLAGGMVLV